MAHASTAWDRYWHFNRIASCMDGAGRSNYDERIAGPWRAFFAGLPPCDVLDICTGNGAVALIAASAGMSVTGIDLAHIDPARFVTPLADRLSKIRFLGETNAAELPFPDRSFGAVVSQYGIEYAPRPGAWREAARVTAPGGRMRLVVHAADGVIAEETRGSLEDAAFLLDEVKLAQRIRDCVQTVHSLETAASRTAEQRKSADDSYHAFQAALDAVAERLSGAADPKMLHNAGSVLADAFAKRRLVSMPILLEKVNDVELEIRCHRDRQQALLDAAMTPDDLQKAATILSDCGLADVTIQPLVADGRLLAHVIEARRPN
jgi:ubiquinone/menaquinone biosynthesis C-methylase UbiE